VAEPQFESESLSVGGLDEIPLTLPSPKSCLRVLIGLTLVAPLAGCAGKAGVRTPRVPVTVARALERPMPFTLTSTGTIEALETAAVSAQVSGIITRVAFHEGQDVRRGDPLFQLDPRPFRAALDRALATLARDRAQAATARADAERAQKLFEQDVLSQADWEQKRGAWEALAATVHADSAAAASARLDLDNATVRAPIAGRTGRQMAHTGDLVRTASADPLVTINQVHPVRVRFTVPEQSVPLIQRYRASKPRVRVVSASGDSTSLEGALVFVDNAVDAASGTLLLKGEFENRDGRLVPGQFVEVRLVLYTDPSATVVPAPAVTNGQQGTYVYVMNADSTVTPRPVSIERTVDELAVVTRGLKAGETVITDGQLRLAPGSRVIVRKASPGRS
jgi:multidrug efflux system membrane fusion protein